MTVKSEKKRKNPASGKVAPPDRRPGPGPAAPGILIGLNAVIVTVAQETPYVLLVRHDREPEPDADKFYGLPFGPFDPASHRTLEMGLRAWVEEQTFLQLGYVEQLYTFGDRDRESAGPGGVSRIVSVGYLALTRDAPELSAPNTIWRDWYRFFPWEDWRDQKPAVIDKVIAPALRKWAEAGSTAGQREVRLGRAALCFGLDGAPWDEEKVLERYELLYEARLAGEALRDRRDKSDEDGSLPAGLGELMISDHRRILATAMGRLRGKLKYRPVVFELMPPTFTLLHLQRSVEAVSGIRLHKQNFRRLVEKEGLVEGTGRMMRGTGGRPAEQFRFRREVLQERPAPGFRVRSPLRPA